MFSTALEEQSEAGGDGQASAAGLWDDGELAGEVEDGPGAIGSRIDPIAAQIQTNIAIDRAGVRREKRREGSLVILS